MGMVLLVLQRRAPEDVHALIQYHYVPDNDLIRLGLGSQLLITSMSVLLVQEQQGIYSIAVERGSQRDFGKICSQRKAPPGIPG